MTTKTITERVKNQILKVHPNRREDVLAFMADKHNGFDAIPDGDDILDAFEDFIAMRDDADAYWASQPLGPDEYAGC